MKLIELFNSDKIHHQRWPILIAEAGVNHECDVDRAVEMIKAANAAGADAIKFQTYKADKLASKHSPSYWDTNFEGCENQYELFKKYDKFGEDEFKELKKVCDREGIEFMSTPFDEESADYINDLVEVFKVSSSDINNYPLIVKISSFNKPMLMSTGAATYEEIMSAVALTNNNKVSLLHCVLNYPTRYEDANLGRIASLKKQFPNNPIGYSDHTLPGDMDVLVVAYLLGARVIEKHFTLDKNRKGNDHYHSMDPGDIMKFRDKIFKINRLIGNGEIDCSSNEDLSRQNARRSIVARKDMDVGYVICRDDICLKRPGTGISPQLIDTVVGKKCRKKILEDDIVTYDMIQ